MILPLAKVPFFMAVLGIVWIVIMLLLGLIILIQKGKGGGLGAALGGMGSGSLLGTKTGDVLTWVTIAFTAAFLILGILLSRFYRPVGLEDLAVEQKTTAPAEAAPTLEELAEETAQEQAEAQNAENEQAEAVQESAEAGAEEADQEPVEIN